MFTLQPFKLFKNAGGRGMCKLIKKAPLRVSTFMLLTVIFVQANNSLAADCYDSFSEPVTISAGTYHAVGLKEDGTVVAVGSCTYCSSLEVSGWADIKAISAGGYHSLGLKEDGTVVGGGSSLFGYIDVSYWAGIKAISSGQLHAVGLKEDGTVVADGSNYYGALNVSGWTGIKAISARYYHTVGLKEDGTVVAVGHNQHGQLNTSGWTGIKAIFTGQFATFGLKEDGTVVAVGDNKYGQLNVSDWTGIKAISSAAYHTVGLKEDGTVVAVGYNKYNPTLYSGVSNWTGIKAISASTTYTAGLKEDGTIVAAYNQWRVVGAAAQIKRWTGIEVSVCGGPQITADAGPDQVVEQSSVDGAEVTLDATGSEGEDIAYDWTWEGGSASGVNPTVLLPAGDTEVTLTITSGSNTSTDTVTVSVQDTMRPSTSVLTSGTPGNNGWYVSTVNVSLLSGDSGSGVREVHYRVNGGAEQVVAGDRAGITIAGDGPYSITYWAVDNVENTEGPGNTSGNIDRTAPAITVTAPNAGDYLISDVLTVGFSAVDTVSGVVSTPATLDGQAVVNGQAITLYTLAPGSHSFAVSSEDNAGNQASKSVAFNIIVTADSLSDLIDILLASGEIDNTGVANSLSQQLENGNINALLNHIDAQDGKHISGYAAELLRTAIASLN